MLEEQGQDIIHVTGKINLYAALFQLQRLVGEEDGDLEKML